MVSSLSRGALARFVVPVHRVDDFALWTSLAQLPCDLLKRWDEGRRAKVINRNVDVETKTISHSCIH